MAVIFVETFEAICKLRNLQMSPFLLAIFHNGDNLVVLLQRGTKIVLNDSFLASEPVHAQSRSAALRPVPEAIARTD